MDALIISNFLLWGVLLCLVLVILALSRQIGVLYERVAPMGALTMDRGPAVGEAARARHQRLAGPSGRGGRRRRAEPAAVLPVAVVPGVQEAAAHPEVGGRDRACVVAHRAGQRRRDAGAPGVLPPGGLERFPYLLSTELGMKFQISKLPYAVLIDESGTIRAKGLVNSANSWKAFSPPRNWAWRRCRNSWPPARPWTRPAFRARRTAMHWLDKLGERAARSVAHATSRRSVLNRIGRLFVGAAFIMPVLPVARAAPPPRSRRPTRPPATTGATARSTASCVPAAAAA